ncbi:MAG TPA: carboxypeptidase-like regulatory domain-containing protein [Edaphobacter sp.]|nr:carboxypeptidase-like regulatory domain-containing protein [Edaphobacter sp.]
MCLAVASLGVCFRGIKSKRFHGFTKGLDNEPVPYSVIVVHRLDGLGDSSLHSDARGAFSTLTLSFGIYEVTASKEGFTAAPKKVVQVAEGTTLPVELTLEPAAQTKEPTGASSAQATSQAPPRRAMESPLDGIFPSTEYLGPTIGVPGTDPTWPLTQAGMSSAD